MIEEQNAIHHRRGRTSGGRRIPLPPPGREIIWGNAKGTRRPYLIAAKTAMAAFLKVSPIATRDLTSKTRALAEAADCAIIVFLEETGAAVFEPSRAPRRIAPDAGPRNWRGRNDFEALAAALRRRLENSPAREDRIVACVRQTLSTT